MSESSATTVQVQAPLEERLKATLVALKNARATAADKREALADAQMDFDESHRQLILDVRMAGGDASRLEHEARELALRLFYERGDGNKKVFPGVELKEFGPELIYDEGWALTWAMEHKICCLLDRRAFEGVARVLGIDHRDFYGLIDLKSTMKATIATDLDKALGKGGIA